MNIQFSSWFPTSTYYDHSLTVQNNIGLPLLNKNKYIYSSVKLNQTMKTLKLKY